MYVATPPSFEELLGRLEPAQVSKAVHQFVSDGVSPVSKYLHWDKVRHLEPPDDLTHEEWWLSMKMARAPLLRRLPLRDEEGRSFAYAMSDEVQRLLHLVDQRCSGEIAMAEVVTANEQAKQHYLVNSLMEEAIRSSQLEGAVTSRRVAKELLRSGRPPRDRSEQMILNNYRAISFMRESVGDRLTPAIVVELQRLLTEGTLDNPDGAGRLQTPEDERVAVVDVNDGSIIHRPPPAEELPERLQLLCSFANARDDPESFLHPVVRAILLHFWLGYDHPFEDGNGRTARALFYWSMRTNGYWLVEYLSISRILREAPAKYSRAYVLSETDEGDTTYFLLYQLSVIRRAVDELHQYLKRKVREVREVEQLVKDSEAYNHRQLALLGDAARHPERSYTFQSHAASHSVTHQTARNDLLALHRLGLLDRRKIGQRYVFSPAVDLTEQLKQAA